MNQNKIIQSGDIQSSNVGKLSIIVPVYNEKSTVLDLIAKVKSVNLSKEIIIIDDGSSDGTREVLAKINDSEIKIVLHEKNQGKGAAIKTALDYISGEVAVIQDADLEYDPNDFIRMLAELKQGHFYAVYGSRFLKHKHPDGMDFLHWLANKIYTFVANLLYREKLTDIATCYKMIRSDILKKIKLESKGFEFCPEVTAKLIKGGVEIKEVPINYKGRSVKEGKKIGLKDAVSYLIAIIKYRFK